MKTFFELREKTLTKAELKKREEVAKAIERENPNTPMDKKMAIATATAKKVAEATLRLDVSKASNDELKQYVKKSSTTIARSPSVHPDVMHTHDAAQKELKKRQKMQEEAEQVDEISRDLARRYIRKVADKTNTGELSTKQVLKRRPGINLAGKKAYPGIAGEPRVRATESVTLDELSKKTLGSYVKKASSDMASNAYNLGARDPLKKPGSWDKAFKRKAGIEKATDKITKEEVEELDELSKKTLGSYVNRSADDISHIQRDITSTGTQSPDYKNLSRMRRNRKSGIATAVKKLTKEEAENLDELSKKTLGTYVKKAAGSAVGLGAITTAQAMSSKGKADPDDKRQLRNRMTGVSRATDRLTKEETELDEVSSTTLMNYSIKAAQQGMKRVAGQKTADEKMRKRDGYSSSAKVAAGPARTRKESVELEEGISNLSHSRLKFHATKGMPHGSYSNKEVKDEHNRRMRTEPDYVKAKASMSEEVELDEVSQAMKDRYIQKSMSSHGHNAAVAKDAKSRGDETSYQKARKIMKKRNQGMGRAFGQTKDTM